jgi:hypothetical protein
MEKATLVLGALDAGKFPDQNQVNQAIDWVPVKIIPAVEPSGGGELGAQGKIIANGLREVLESCKQLGSNKNGQYFSAVSGAHDLLNHIGIQEMTSYIQKALWHISRPTSRTEQFCGSHGCRSSLFRPACHQCNRKHHPQSSLDQHLKRRIRPS